jgi:predicted phosphate transport protein (TIGR00153 family)
MKSTNPIAALFGRSPFKAMQKHMAIVAECVGEVPPLFEALIAGDQESVVRAKERIFEREQAADAVKNQVRIHLPRSLFLPVDRRDLLEVLDRQDAIADIAQDIAGMLVTRRMTVPENMQADLRALVQRSVDACSQAVTVINELDELVETGFRGPEATRVETMVETLTRTEDETDRLGIALVSALFAREDSMSPISVMLWYRLIQCIGDLADSAKTVGDRLLPLIAR